MSARDARDDLVESVLIAYGWPRAQDVPILPEDAMARWPPEAPLADVPRVTGYIYRRKMAGDSGGRHAPQYTNVSTSIFSIHLQEKKNRGVWGACRPPV